MLIYLLKSSACLAIFFLFYKLFLEKENMHVFKRFYLLISLTVAFIIPLITFTSYAEFGQGSINQNILLTEVAPHQVNGSLFDLSFVLWSIYGIGLAVFGIIFIKNLSQILSKIKHNPKVKNDSITNVLLLDLIIPHTFFNYIFLNKQKFENREIPKEVLLHEQTHAIQKHSVDILIIEALQVVFWFNPLIYFIKHAVKLNHEFLADQAVLNHGIETSNYQKTLLNFSANTNQPQLANSINYSFIKKRFTIMKTHTSKKAIWIRSIILLPLLSVLIYSFSDRVIVEKERSIQNSTQENLQKINGLQLGQEVKEIKIKINKKEEILLNDEKLVTLETLANEIKKIITNYTPTQLASVKAVIEVQGDVKTGLITDIKNEFRKTGIYLLNIRFNGSERNLYLNQDKATPEQIAEYNGIVKALMDQPENKRIIKQKDVKRIEHIYNLMTEVQKKKAEPFPKFVPPPPPPPIPDAPSIKETTDVPPPQYSKPRRVYKDQKLNDVPPPPKSSKPDTIHKINGWKVTGVSNDIPPPPLPKDATYYINGKKASLKQVKDLDADDIIRMEVIKNKESKKGEVYITTKQ